MLSHPFFADISREDLLSKKVKAPFIPEVRDADDTSHFDERFQQLEALESVIDQSKQQLVEQHKDDFETF